MECREADNWTSPNVGAGFSLSNTELFDGKFEHFVVTYKANFGLARTLAVEG